MGILIGNLWKEFDATEVIGIRFYDFRLRIQFDIKLLLVLGKLL